MRSQLRFFIFGHSGMLVNASGNIDQFSRPAPLENKDTINEVKYRCLKSGVHMKAVFWLGIIVLMQITRLRFKQSRISMLISHIYVLGRFVNFLVIFMCIWR